jgi:hypothetical protein
MSVEPAKPVTQALPMAVAPVDLVPDTVDLLVDDRPVLAYVI